MEKKEQNERALPKRVRGVATIDEMFGVVFKPFSEGVSRKEDVKTVRSSSLYTTAGEKKRSKVCHLSVDADAKDPIGDMLEDFVRLTKSDVVCAYTSARGKKLLENDALRIVANKTKRTVTTTITINIGVTPNYEKELFNQFQEILKCFTFNQRFLVSFRSVRK